MHLPEVQSQKHDEYEPSEQPTRQKKSGKNTTCSHIELVRLNQQLLSQGMLLGTFTRPSHQRDGSRTAFNMISNYVGSASFDVCGDCAWEIPRQRPGCQQSYAPCPRLSSADCIRARATYYSESTRSS
ncbi:hypothetical protein VTO42DRAFT_7197 [Malbranchea cinnamomea]